MSWLTDQLANLIPVQEDSSAHPPHKRLSPLRLLSFLGGTRTPPRKHPVEVAHTRLIVTGVMFGLAFITVAGRLVDVTAISGASEPRVVRASTPIKVERADITDRNGILLATSIATSSVFADPRKISDPAGVAAKLVSVLPDLNEQVIRDRLSSGKSFVYIRRNLTPRQEFEVNRLGIPGIQFERQDKRVYPHGAVVSHVLGFSDIDNKGISGVEKFFNDTLRTQPDPLQLSLDLRLQHIVRQELQVSVDKFQALGGAGMIMDAYTGEVLAMVSLPDFDPNAPGQAPDVNRFNRNTLGVYEMGSTFKIFNTAMALEAGTTTMRGGYDATNPIQIARFTIKDDHAKKRWLSTPEIFMYSSNIGSVKMAMDVGVPGQRAFMDKLGLTRPVKLELPEIGSPQIPVPWRPINLMTIAFGHGMSVSPLHMVSGVSTVVNGGVAVPPTLVRRPYGEPIQGTRVLNPKVSDSMRRLMRLVVVRGTGTKANAVGYPVGGKTGTAEKAGGRAGYQEHKLLSSFVGAFPIQSPKYVVFIAIDEPKGTKDTYGYATAGWTAAPTVSRVVARMAPLLGLPPVDESDPEFLRQTAIEILEGGPRRAVVQ